MDQDIENMVNTCKGCALAAKAPLITHKPWPKTDRPWSRIHVDFTGPLEGFYYLIVVDSYSKWSEVLRCKNPTTEATISYLHELFAHFEVVDCLISDNGTQFTSTDFKEFCKIFQIKHITTPPYHPRSNGQAERFVDTLKRALKKAYGTPKEKALQQFLQVYRIMPNVNAPASLSPAEIMFARKVRSVFDKLLTKQTKQGPTSIVPRKKYSPREKVFFKMFKNNTSFWEPGTIEKRIRNMVYIIQGPRFSHKRHLNQIRKRLLDDCNSTPQEEVVMDTIYDTFDIQIPQAAPEL